MDLSWRRAENVRRYLIKRGVEPERLTLSAYGKVRLIKDATTDPARARNRRVEFRIMRIKRVAGEDDQEERSEAGEEAPR